MKLKTSLPDTREFLLFDVTISSTHIFIEVYTCHKLHMSVMYIYTLHILICVLSMCEGCEVKY